MARPSEDRIEGYHCENRIKKGKRKGQICGKLLFAKNGLTIWDDRCESTHSLLGLLRKAIDLKYLTPEDVFKSIPELHQQQLREEKEMVKQLEVPRPKLSKKKIDELEKILLEIRKWRPIPISTQSISEYFINQVLNVVLGRSLSRKKTDELEEVLLRIWKYNGDWDLFIGDHYINQVLDVVLERSKLSNEKINELKEVFTEIQKYDGDWPAGIGNYINKVLDIIPHIEKQNARSKSRV